MSRRNSSIGFVDETERRLFMLGVKSQSSGTARMKQRIPKARIRFLKMIVKCAYKLIIIHMQSRTSLMRIFSKFSPSNLNVSKNEEEAARRVSYLDINKSLHKLHLQDTTLLPKLSINTTRPVFKMEDFMAPRTVDQVFALPTIEKVLEKPFTNRTEYDSQMLDRMLMTIPYFQLYSRFPILRRQIGRCLRYRKYTEGTILMRQGYKPIYVYILVKGNVTVIRKEGNTHWTKVLKKGQALGDIELRKDVKRLVSILVESEMIHLLEMDADAFHQLVLQFQDLLTTENMKIMNTISIFADMKVEDLKNLAKSALIKEYAPGSSILIQGDPYPECAFFLIKGKCKVVKAVPVTRLKNAQERAHGCALEARISKQYKLGVYPDDHHQSKALMLEFEKIENGQFFGDESLFLNPVRMSRKTCLREHFRYPMLLTNLPEQVELAFDQFESQQQEQNQLDDQSLTLDEVKKLFDRRVFDRSLFSIFLSKENSDVKLFYRRTMTSVISETTVQCLLIPKLKLLRFISDSQFEALRRQSLNTKLRRLVVEDQGDDDEKASEGKIARPLMLHDDWKSNPRSSFQDNEGRRIRDRFEEKIDESLWRMFCQEDGWTSFKKAVFHSTYEKVQMMKKA